MMTKQSTPKKRGAILVIDDEPDICELFEQVLGAEGYTVLSAYNAVSYTHLTLPTNREV